MNRAWGLGPSVGPQAFREGTIRGGCSASTTFAGALPHPNRYSTKVVASAKMLPKTREAATWAEASARWRSRNLWRQLSRLNLLIIDELGFVPLSTTGAELLFEVFSQRYERGSILVTTNLPFDEWTEVFGSERLTGALLDRLTHHVHILEMNGESYRLKRSRENAAAQAPDESDNP